jgi:hypothetical protein
VGNAGLREQCYPNPLGQKGELQASVGISTYAAKVRRGRFYPYNDLSLTTFMQAQTGIAAEVDLVCRVLL